MVLRTPLLTWNDSPPCLLLPQLPPTLRRHVRYRLIPRFGALPLLGRRWFIRLPLLPYLSCCGVGKSVSIGNCRILNNHQGSAPKRGNRGTRSPRCCVSGTQSPNRASGLTVQGNKGVLRTLVLSQLLVTFLWREKSPAGGINTYQYTVGQKRTSSPRQKRKTKNPCSMSHAAGTFPYWNQVK